MAYYWEPDSTYQKSSSSSGRKIAAIIIILMLVISSGVIILFNLLPSIQQTGSEGQVRVAVIDSGLDVDFSIIGRVGPQQSFISPLYGYQTTDSSTADSNPDDGNGNTVSHGTLVAHTILENSNNAQIVVAKVIDSTGFATSSGVIAAINWAIEQNCSVINLSLGSGPTYGDPLEGAVDYAFSKGVIVVSAAGNEGMSGVSGSSISSPSIYTKAISVGALDENDSPADYTSWGPTASRYMKPDIAIEGYTETTNAIYFGTSFASPRVAAIVVDLIAYCLDNNLSYTPGMIQAALYSGADALPYAEYIVGAGKASLQGAIQVIEQATRENDLPLITYVHPVTIPLDFERLFQGDNYTFNVNIVTSGMSEYNVTLHDLDSDSVHIPQSISVNQTDLIPLFIHVSPNSSQPVDGEILFDAGPHSDTLTVEYNPSESIARIAFDTSHTPWSIDTVYGQFKELYLELLDNDISVMEISNRSLLTTDYLSIFDAVFVLDPCAWGTDETNYANPVDFSIPYTQEEIDAYKNYYLQGGGIFVSALDNESVNTNAANDFLNWSGFSLGSERMPASGNPLSITNLEPHPITSGVLSFGFVGASVSFNSSTAQSLASYNGITVLAGMSGTGGGRMVVTGTNFFIDNWGMSGLYGTTSDRILALKIALWLIGNI
ncbi:MAG: S8 family serine peptidase [Candidatus Thorarchaeota archaeon]